MRVLFDTNIILDVLLNRAPFALDSAATLGHVENKEIEGYLCATTITTLDYLLSKTLNRNKSKASLQKLLSIFNIADVNTAVLKLALNSDFKDFEDAVQYYSGVCCGAQSLVTRNIKDYKNTELPVYMPDELLDIIELNKNSKT